MIPRACGVALTWGALVGAAPAASAGGPARVAHHGEWSDDGILWQGDWVDGKQRTLELRFVEPLPEGSEVLGVWGASPVLGDEGRIVALDVSTRPGLGQFELRIPQDLDGDRLVVPLVEGSAVQRVTLDGVDFTPSDRAGLEKHVRYWASPALAGDGRKAFERAARRDGWDRARPNDQAVYVRAEQRYASGIPGRLRPEGQVSLAVHGLLAAVLLALMGLGGALYRGLDRQARAERNRAYIDRHFGQPSADADPG